MSTRSKTKLPIRGRKKNKVRYIPVTKNLSRIPKLTEKLIDECVDLILEGLPINKVCDYLCITKDSYYDWKDKGEAYLRRRDTGKKPDNPDHEIHAMFTQIILRAHAQWQLEIQRRSMQTGSKHSSMWIRDMTQLERRDRQNWGKTETVNVVDSAPLPDEAYL